MHRSSSDVPHPPGKPDVSDIDKTEMTVTWTAPEFDGGSPITGYILEKRDTSTEKWIRVNKEPVKQLTYKCEDLTEGSEYEFRVIAENKAGQSKPSDVSDKFIAKPPYGEKNSHSNAYLVYASIIIILPL